MAIGSNLTPHNVENFVHPRRTWYSSKIPNAHNQLRHMASAPQADIIYFANKKDVFKIETASQKRKHVTELPFEPKCTATGHGFFCAGDDKGYFAYLRIPEGATPLTHASDSPLADLAAASQRLGYSSLLDDPAFLGQIFPSRTRIERIGRDIMNSISIHRIRSPIPGVDDDVVALITCNDKVVRIWSLTRDQEQVVDEFPQPMNHATMSPDQQRLVIVGDHDVIYFYRRHDIQANLQHLKRTRDKEISWYSWHQERMFQLPTGSRFDSLAYFTTAWSDSGKLCATASESGYITVFDTNMIADAEDVMDCVLTIVPSSRPQTAAGAVRTMCFAPDPWDYLVWAENNGRLCVGDLRSRLVVRQLVKLDPKVEGTTKVSLTDTNCTPSSALDHSGVDWEMEFIRQRQRELGSDVDSYASMSSSLHRRSDYPIHRDSGLDEDERQILDNLRTSRERNEAHQAALRDLQGTTSSPSPRSISYLPGARNVDRHEARTAPSPGTHTPIPGTGSGSELARLRQDAAVLDTLRNYMRESNETHHRSPRQQLASPARRRTGPNPVMPSSTADMPNLDSSEEPRGSDPWRTIEAAISRVRDEGPETYANMARDAVSRVRGDHPVQDPYLNLPPLMQSLGGNERSHSSLNAVNVNLPANSSSRGTSTATGVTLPSIRDPPLQHSASERPTSLLRPREITSSAAMEPPSLLGSDPQLGQLERQRQMLRQRERDQDRERSQERQRERERSWRREALAARQYETGLLRRVGVAPPLRVMNPQEAAMHRRVYALPANEAEREEWGIGTAGVMIPPLPNGSNEGDASARMVASGSRTVFVGTEDGILELKLDFQSRKRLPEAEWR